eukprot:746575-Hanusia_phi.AAC.1
MSSYADSETSRSYAVTFLSKSENAVCSICQKKGHTEKDVSHELTRTVSVPSPLMLSSPN